jgi:uncharacterized SAM-binding protein YcdF (DUF218 family)
MTIKPRDPVPTVKPDHLYNPQNHRQRCLIFTFPKPRALAVAVVLGGLLLAGFAHVPILRGIASFLIVEDPLQPATAIVPLAGQTPFREMEAAKLYHAGWAPAVIVVREVSNTERQALEELGISIPHGWELSRDVLLREGVPASAIRIAKEYGVGTLEELQAAYKALASQRPAVSDQRSGEMPVILVTSKYHTRRTRLTWDYVTSGRSAGIVRSAARDHFDPQRWWQQRGFALSVVREYLGLMNYYAGFPVAAGQ